MRFEDKVVIVTGASSGIGEGVARKFLDEGALVVGCGIEPEMHIESSRAIYVQANLTEFAQAQHVVEEAVKAFGRVNKLVCCARVTFVGSLETTDYDTFMRELSINMGGVFNMCKAAISELKKQEGSTIVNVGSDLGVRPIPERIGYCPSNGRGNHADQVHRPGVRAPHPRQRHSSGPGAHAHDRAALHRGRGPGGSGRILRQLVPPAQDGQDRGHGQRHRLLSSDESGFITGEIMQVCGGSLI